MKNIHVIPTDKETRLYLSNYGKELNLASHPKTLYSTGQHIYITNDEEIKEGDWCYQVELNDGKVDKCYDVTLYHTWTNNGVDKTRKFKKIILTTNQDLIKDGVQAIDDEFLEWFIKNPSCEEVEVLKCPIEGLYTLIPKEKVTKCYCGHTKTCDCGPEEPKQDKIMERFIANAKQQETLEESAQRFLELWVKNNSSTKSLFIEGAKWQQERMYSEEDIKLAFEEGFNVCRCVTDNIDEAKECFNEWFNRFKKK